MIVIKVKLFLIVVTVIETCRGGSDLTSIRSLIKQSDLKAAKSEAQRLLEADPDNVEAKHLLAYTHAAGEGGDLREAVRLGLEIVTGDQVRAFCSNHRAFHFTDSSA